VTISEFAAILVAISVVVVAVILVVAVNNLNRTLAKLEDTAHQLRDEGIGAFRELRQLIADADAELDKVDLVLDRADQATTAISETSRRTHEAVQDPVIRSLAIASGSSKVTKSWLGARRQRRKAKKAEAKQAASDKAGESTIAS